MTPRIVRKRGSSPVLWYGLTRSPLDAHFPAPERFVELTVLAGSAVVPTFDHEDSAPRLALTEAVAREIEPVVRRYRSGDKLIVPTFWHIAVAYASYEERAAR